MSFVNIARGLRTKSSALLVLSAVRQATGGGLNLQRYNVFGVSVWRNISRSSLSSTLVDGPKYSQAQVHPRFTGKPSNELEGFKITDTGQPHGHTSCAHVSQEGAKFSDFPLDEKIINRLEELGYHEPFDIQLATLQHTLNNRDVIARALTGSGKTLAFAIPIVHKLCQRGPKRNSNPRAIVISPTRELCLQIHRSIEQLDQRLKCVAIYGGTSFHRQERDLLHGVDVVCATPGRLNDHIRRGNLRLEELEFLCLDEADELFTPGFKEQIENVLVSSPSDKQVMLFSATMPPEIKAITYPYMREPVEVDITANQKYKAPESVRHLCMQVPQDQHLIMVQSLVNEHEAERCLVFMETKKSTHRATAVLQRMGLRAEGISSDLSQNQRENIMASFRSGKTKVLVATDVAARGLDIPELDLVIQVGPPRNGSEYYIHRSGRTGRAGRDGLAIMLHIGDSRDRQTIKEVRLARGPLWESKTMVKQDEMMEAFKKFFATLLRSFRIQRVVKLEHVKPHGYEKIIQASAEKLIDTLEKSSDRDMEMILPAVQQLNLSEEQRERLLVAAIAAMMKGPEDKGRRERPAFQERKNSRYPQRGPPSFRQPYNQYQHRGHRDVDPMGDTEDNFWRAQEGPQSRRSNQNRGLRNWDNNEDEDDVWDAKPTSKWTSR